MGVYKYLNVGRDVQELDSGKKITFLLGFALVKEKGGFAFISTVKLHFSLVFWVRNA